MIQVHILGVSLTCFASSLRSVRLGSQEPGACAILVRTNAGAAVFAKAA